LQQLPTLWGRTTPRRAAGCGMHRIPLTWSEVTASVDNAHSVAWCRPPHFCPRTLPAVPAAWILPGPQQQAVAEDIAVNSFRASSSADRTIFVIRAFRLFGNSRGVIGRPFTEAHAFVRDLKLSTVLEWRKYTHSKTFPADIPKSPDRGYEGWIDWGEWLGTGRDSGAP